MSVLLVSPDEIKHRYELDPPGWVRPIPKTLRWWRKHIKPQRVTGHLVVAQLQIDNLPENWHQNTEGPEWEKLVPWSMRLEYFDGRDDWSFPYDYWFYTEDETKDFEEFERTILTRRRVWLDVLAPLPPDGRVDCRNGWKLLDRHATLNYTLPEHPQREAYYTRYQRRLAQDERFSKFL